MSMFPPPRQRWRGDFILPMINIVFLLLLFFLTAGSLANRNEAHSRVPVTATLPLERLPRPLLLIQTDGSLELDGVPVAPSDVVPKLQEIFAASRLDSLPVSVLADPTMRASDLLAVVDMMRAAGIGVRLVTLRREATTEGAS